jgi:hypothetical protein
MILIISEYDILAINDSCFVRSYLAKATALRSRITVTLI